MSEALIYDAIRTPRGRGRLTGALYRTKPVELLAVLLRELTNRYEFDTAEVDDAIIGCVTPTLGQGYNIAKTALLHADWADSVPGVTLNRYCTSALEAVNLAATKIMSGWEHAVVAGGVESMSRIPMASDGGALLYDPMVMTENRYVPQGISADLIATIEGYSREDVDAYALQSQQRSERAREQGYFDRSIVPIYDRNGMLLLDHDENIRLGTDAEQLAKLPPAFASYGKMGYDAMAIQRYPEVEYIDHVHTAGNSSGIVDGASLVLLGSKAFGEANGIEPRARIRSLAVISTEPTIMLTGPTPATRKALLRANMTASDIDLWEMNEAFSAPVLKFQRDLDIDNDKLNVNGGSISMGHPLGATGAMLLGTLLDELERRDLATGAVTLCAGGGMGVTTIIERV